MENTAKNSQNQSWFALQVKPRRERAIAAALRGKGFEEFLPVYRVHHRWSDRIEELEEPYFPGYVFCRFDSTNRLPILTTPGVQSILGIGKTPAPVPDSEIAALQTVVNSGCPAEAWPFLIVGQIVRIEGGSLSGLEGVLVERKSSSRVVVSVALLQRSIGVEIDHRWVYPIAPMRVPVQSAGCQAGLRLKIA